MHSNLTTTTTAAPSSPSDLTMIIGYCCMALACLFFGILNLPVKHYKTGDGMFFQLLVGLSIWSASLIVNCVRGQPEFYALPMLGGFFWSTANLQTVPTIKLLGIGISQTINNLVSLVFGWAYARFGWFGIRPEQPANVGLNYAGVAVCALSVVVYLFVKVNEPASNTTQKQIQSDSDEEVTEEATRLLGRVQRKEEEDEGLEFYEKLGAIERKAFGVVVAIVGGVFFGATFAPILYVQDNYEGASPNGNDYAFSLGTGILFSSLGYFVVYCVVRRNRPRIYPELMLPAFTTGR